VARFSRDGRRAPDIDDLVQNTFLKCCARAPFRSDVSGAQLAPRIASMMARRITVPWAG